jgi:nucleotide-binding universal stress UspA family protein
MPLFPARVLVAADRSSSSRTALAAARALAEATGSELWLVHVKLLTPTIVGDRVTAAQYERLEQEGEGLLADLRAEVEQDGGAVAQTVVRMGKRIEHSVAALAEEIEAGVIVVGGTTRGRVDRTMAGDIAVSLVKRAPCAVLVVPPHTAEGTAQGA